MGRDKGPKVAKGADATSTSDAGAKQATAALLDSETASEGFKLTGTCQFCMKPYDVEVETCLRITCTAMGVGSHTDEGAVGTVYHESCIKGYLKAFTWAKDFTTGRKRGFPCPFRRKEGAMCNGKVEHTQVLVPRDREQAAREAKVAARVAAQVAANQAKREKKPPPAPKPAAPPKPKPQPAAVVAAAAAHALQRSHSASAAPNSYLNHNRTEARAPAGYRSVAALLDDGGRCSSAPSAWAAAPGALHTSPSGGVQSAASGESQVEAAAEGASSSLPVGYTLAELTPAQRKNLKRAEKKRKQAVAAAASGGPAAPGGTDAASGSGDAPGGGAALQRAASDAGSGWGWGEDGKPVKPLSEAGSGFVTDASRYLALVGLAGADSSDDDGDDSSSEEDDDDESEAGQQGQPAVPSPQQLLSSGGDVRASDSVAVVGPPAAAPPTAPGEAAALSGVQPELLLAQVQAHAVPLAPPAAQHVEVEDAELLAALEASRREAEALEAYRAAQLEAEERWHREQQAAAAAASSAAAAEQARQSAALLQQQAAAAAAVQPAPPAVPPPHMLPPHLMASQGPTIASPPPAAPLQQLAQGSAAGGVWLVGQDGRPVFMHGMSLHNPPHSAPAPPPPPNLPPHLLAAGGAGGAAAPPSLPPHLQQAVAPPVQHLAFAQPAAVQQLQPLPLPQQQQQQGEDEDGSEELEDLLGMLGVAA